MDTQKVNGVPPKENGGPRRPPPYSVETPYGFHLDLDFLKYVDDIEKGNTIKRVPIQRRQRGQSRGPLSRNLSLPGYGCRPSQWNSFGTLFPKSRLADSNQRYEFQPSDSRSAGFSKQSVTASFNSFTNAEMEATIQAFDEQPLGLHVRPNLLRASSLPLTVLLRKQSETTEEPANPNGSRDYLAHENGSSEDIFHSPERKPGGVNGTIQQLTAALQRVGELEEEIRVIPELKAQICILQEERERLLHRFHSETIALEPTSIASISLQSSSNADPLETQNKTHDDWMNREYDQLEENVKASSEQVDAIAIPLATERELIKAGGNLQGTKIKDNRDSVDHGDRAKSLTETLQRKVVMLEQKLHELESELDKTGDLLKQQAQESLVKDERIKELTMNSENVWVRATTKEDHPFIVDVTSSSENLSENKSHTPFQDNSQETAKTDQLCSEEGHRSHALRTTCGSHADMEHHVKRVKELLHEQWDCLCRKDSSGRVLSSEHLPPRVCNIQEQLVTLVSLLSLYVSPTGGEITSELKMEDHTYKVEKSTRESPTKENARDISDEETTGSSIIPKDEEDHWFVKEIFQPESVQPEQQSSMVTHKEMTGHAEDTEKSSSGDGSLKETMKTVDLECTRSTGEEVEDQHSDNLLVKDKAEQSITSSEAEIEEALQGKGGRETKVCKDFMTACQYLEEHIDRVSDPNDEMRESLTLVFQQWFHVSAEEQSCADTLAVYLDEVAAKTPSVLPFLVNMVDDNGNTALHYSVSHSNFSIVQLLLYTGVCEVDLRNKIGYTAIMLASLVSVDSPEDLRVIQHLMELGDVNARVGQVGQTALHLAVRNGRASMVRLLLAHGANVNAQDRAGTTALISACDRGHTDIVRILLEDPDCDVDLTDKGGRSALSLATQASHTDIADLLKAHYTPKNPDKCRMT